MNERDVWQAIYLFNLFLNMVSIVTATVICLQAVAVWRIEAMGSIRRDIARGHVWNQGIRLCVAILLMAWVLSWLEGGPPAIIRPVTWRAISLITAISILVLFAVVREFRARQALRAKAERALEG